MPTAKLSVRVGCSDCFVEADFRIIPGEPMVRYYPDGSGYPGSPPEIDCIDRVKLIEVEQAIDGDYTNEKSENWAYYDRDDLFARSNGAAWVAETERAVCEELSSGSYDDELLDCADYPEDEYYE